MNRSTARRLGATAVALACLAPVALVASPAAAATPETGTLTLTVFEDRYPDARFDSSLTTASGESDRIREGGYVYLQDSAGNWFGTGSENNGEYIFDGIALGEAKVYAADPNVYESVAYFVSDGDEATAMRHGKVSFTGGTFLFPGSDRRIAWSGPEMLAGEGTVTVGAESEALIGLTGVGASVRVLSAEDGAPVAGKAEIIFLANSERIESNLVADGVTYYPGTRRLIPSNLGIQVEPVAGLAVAEVTARSSISGQPLNVTMRDGAYFVDATGLARYFDRAEFSVQLINAESGMAECKNGGWTTMQQPVFKNQGQCVSFFATTKGGK
ncbi:hypothetical protein [Cryobacterium sp. BB736]|uniref:hypothetical protein n=1 Tax=Cryobacterium sp. BB736 TaxID=2746963 RepID=UPI00187541B5|nr:hypothetical protein [Cryobacterium sp. BB736]